MLTFVKNGLDRVILLGIFVVATIYVNVIDRARAAESEK